MSVIRIGKRYTFDAAHRLPLHNGKCARPHGHTYTLDLEITGQPITAALDPEQGMVLDYYKISEIVKREIMDRFDHQDLNKVMRPWFGNMDPEEYNLTTAENMVGIFAAILRVALAPYKANLTRVRLCETQTSWAEWHSTENK